MSSFADKLCKLEARDERLSAWRKCLQEFLKQPPEDEPSAYKVTPNSSVPDVLADLRCALEEEAVPLLGSAEGLMFLREVALLAAGTAGGFQDAAAGGAAFAWSQQWVSYLTDFDRSASSYFLQHFIARDGRFYEGTPSVRPKRSESRPHGWENVFGWLDTRQLSIPEMELALALLDWDSTGRAPKLVWWVREHPYVLRKVHRFFLRRYCFQLLPVLRRAMREAKIVENKSLYRAPFRAGEFWRLYPRIGGLGALGVLVLVAIDAAVAAFMAAPLMFVTLLLVLFWLTALWLVYMDIFKQNSGVMAEWSHAAPRALSLVWRMVVWAAVLALALAGFWLLAATALDGTDAPFLPGGEAALGNLVIPDLEEGYRRGGGIMELALRMFTMASGGVLIGCLLQWFWEDRAATDPI